MSPYIYVAAVILAILPILFIYKITIERIKENPEELNKAQVHFFIVVFLSEVIPLILILYGFTNLTPVAAIEELYLPAIIIVLLVGVATLFIFLQRMFDVQKSTQNDVNKLALMCFVLVNSIPVLAIISLIIKIP